MWVKLSRYLVVGTFVLVAASTLWVNSQANKQVDEANAAVQSANALTDKASPLYTELFSEANLLGYPANRDKLRVTAQETIDLFANAAKQYRLSADKLEVASQKGVKKPVADYWTLKVQGTRKLAESKEAFGNVVRLLLDETISDLDTLVEKMKPLVDQAVRLDEASDQLEAEAQTFQEAHKSEIN